MKYKSLKYAALGRLCRKCINEEYGLQLSRKDCLYWIYPATCRCCGQIKNIVADIAPFSRWKIWLSRKD